MPGTEHRICDIHNMQMRIWLKSIQRLAVVPMFRRHQTHMFNLLTEQQTINSATQHRASTKLQFQRAFNPCPSTQWIDGNHRHNPRRGLFSCNVAQRLLC